MTMGIHANVEYMLDNLGESCELATARAAKIPAADLADKLLFIIDEAVTGDPTQAIAEVRRWLVDEITAGYDNEAEDSRE